ncbi:MAG: hypothetical protein M1368_11250, partial [Thaumarchaeota archaeon]|nr:hypothetical protein [Nitrososphaerota archaeon]
ANGRDLHVSCVVTRASSLDTKGDSSEAVPSYEAVSALSNSNWVVLTNGRLWRLYSGRVNSPSTNYFEIDLEAVSGKSDPRLNYFVSLFSAASFIPKADGSDLDSVYELGLRYAKEIEDQLRTKVFEGQLFLNLARAVLSHTSSRKHTETELDAAKATALRLLYRILFVLYAESRNLLPTDNEKYMDISLEAIRRKLNDYEKKPEEHGLWQKLSNLFNSIEKGNVSANVPEYDGELFRRTEGLDDLKPKNRFLAPALRELCEWNGRGIDYQNLGVRQLGSLYEALLEYNVRQAKEDLVVYKDGTLDAAAFADLKQKPKPFVEKGELYLASKGVLRKGTGSYYTPDEIVKFLTVKGLEPILETRKRSFEDHVKQLKEQRKRDEQLERAVIEDLLGVKVIDPAMGSGHFLVSAVDRITSWITDRLREHPEAPLARIIDEEREEIIKTQGEKGIEIDPKLLTDAIILKRLVMKRCVYGVDINPLAVELAKLSLWLDSFTIGVPLTFLDHHIRCGDSLIGLSLKDMVERVPNETLDAWSGDVNSTAKTLSQFVSTTADLTKEQVEQSRKNYEQYRESTKVQRSILDMICAGMLDEKIAKTVQRNVPLFERTIRDGKKLDWWTGAEDAFEVAKKYRVFHWELEFPEACSSGQPSFDLVLTNPPWDEVMPKDNDFFSSIHPHFRSITNKQEKLKVVKDVLKDSEVGKRYSEYLMQIDQRLNFYKNSGHFNKRGTGHNNLWKLFLERSLSLTSKEGGNMAIVIPSGIVTDEGAKQLRKELFKGNIKCMYEFENSEGIFDIHRSYKFVLLVADNKPRSMDSFAAAFYLHKIESLGGKTEREKFVEIPIQLVRTSAPDSLSIPELQNRESLETFSKLYQRHPLLNDMKSKNWSVSLIWELNRSTDSDIFKRSNEGWPLIEGKDFHQFIPDYEKPEFFVDVEDGLKRTGKHREYRAINERIHKTVRLAFRDVASSTNVRATIACILPPKSFCPHTATIVMPSTEGTDKDTYLELIAYLAGIFNSFVFDFLIRNRVTMHVSFFYVYQTPVPSDCTSEFARRICSIAAHLSSPDERFSELAEAFELRPHGMTMQERVELSAELNALVGFHYGLTQKEMKVVLDSFDGFKEDENILKLEGEIKWTDELIRKFNGEVKKRVLPYFNKLQPKGK